MAYVVQSVKLSLYVLQDSIVPFLRKTDQRWTFEPCWNTDRQCFSSPEQSAGTNENNHHQWRGGWGKSELGREARTAKPLEHQLG